MASSLLKRGLGSFTLSECMHETDDTYGVEGERLCMMCSPFTKGYLLANIFKLSQWHSEWNLATKIHLKLVDVILSLTKTSNLHSMYSGKMAL